MINLIIFSTYTLVIFLFGHSIGSKTLKTSEIATKAKKLVKRKGKAKVMTYQTYGDLEQKDEKKAASKLLKKIGL